MGKKIVFYDSECGMCNWFVQFLLKMDTKDIFFAPLFGKTHKGLLGDKYDGYDTVIYYENDKVYIKAQAVVRILATRFKLLSVFLILPLSIFDPVYDFIAKRRKQLFSSKYCLVPDKDKLRFFLD